jgi:hypothetical protein
MPLFKTTPDLQAYYPARLTFDIDDLLPTLKQVELEYLGEQLLGEDLYAELEGQYQDDLLDPLYEELLELCRPAVAHLAVYHFTGIANVELTSGGLAVGKTDTKSPAAEWRTRDLERAVLRQGYRALDVLVNWLLKHVDELEEWQDSPLYAELNAGYLRTTQHFDGLVRIGNSGYLFRQMVPAIRRIEQGAVADTLCSTTLRERLPEGISAADLTTQEATYVRLAREAAAHLAMADSIVQLALGIDERGVWTFNSLLGGGQTSAGVATASDARLQARIDQERALGNAALKKLADTLQADAVADENHPYRATTCYVDPTLTTTTHLPNTESPVGGFM